MAISSMNPSNAQRQDTYALADFRAGVRGAHWFAEGWVKNAFDAHYVPIAIPFSSASGYVGESGAPVTLALRVGISVFKNFGFYTCSCGPAIESTQPTKSPPPPAARKQIIASPG